MLSILFCSLDSFLASLGIGLIESSAINRRRFIAAFALCDWLGTLVGAAVRLGTPHLRPGGLGLTLASLFFGGIAVAVMASSKRGRKRLCHHGERRIPAGSREHDPGLQWRHRLRGGHRTLEVSKDRDGASFFDTR